VWGRIRRDRATTFLKELTHFKEGGENRENGWQGEAVLGASTRAKAFFRYNFWKEETKPLHRVWGGAIFRGVTLPNVNSGGPPLWGGKKRKGLAAVAMGACVIVEGREGKQKGSVPDVWC